MKYYAIAIGLLSISACNEQPVISHYLCNQAPAKLDIISNKHATLSFNNQDYLLNHEVSASGAKYINKEVLFWSRGNQAMLIINGEKYHCSIN